MFIKSSICGVLTLLSTTSAFALTCAYDYGGTASCAPDTTTAGNCETLGFSKNNVSNCEQYIYCPFDASYKRCASLDCTAYTLSSCPANGYCSSCKAGGYTHLALDGCNKGYVKSGNSCPANPCTGYPLSSCPSSASSCSTCLSGKTNKYKVNGCKDGYTASGNTCVCAKTCKDTATVPDNATAVTETCTACGVDTEIITGFKCNDGYQASDNSCVCATTCKDTATVPDNATAVTETCTACGVDTEIITGFKCNDGYVKVNDTCQKAYASCEDAGYFTDDTNRDCSSTATIYLTDGNTTECYTSCSCKSGYTLSGNTCVAAACSGYPLYSCPSSATSCSRCKSGSSYKYKVNGCKDGYTLSGDTCVKEQKQCPNGQHYYGGKCTNCNTLRSNCKKECDNQYDYDIDLQSCYQECDRQYSACTSASTTYSYDYGNGIGSSLMLALDTISENQCKVKYSQNLAEMISEDDCIVYNA